MNSRFGSMTAVGGLAAAGLRTGMPALNSKLTASLLSPNEMPRAWVWANEPV
jgi:hypothetical protein